MLKNTKPAVNIIGCMNHWHRPDRNKCCIACGQELPLAEFSAYKYTTKQGKLSVRYESRCRACNRARRNARYKDPHKRQIDQSTSLRWKHEHKEHLQQYQKGKQTTEEFKALKATHQRLRKARIRAGTNKADTPEIKATYAEAIRLQKETGVAYHVDHIMPLKHGGKHEAGNLQILTATENMKKGARLPRLAVTKENGHA